MVNTEIRLIIFFVAKGGEALYSQQKQDQELTVAQTMTVDGKVEELSGKGMAAQRVALAGSHHAYRLKGQRRIEWCAHTTPGDPPPPRASSLALIAGRYFTI